MATASAELDGFSEDGIGTRERHAVKPRRYLVLVSPLCLAGLVACGAATADPSATAVVTPAPSSADPPSTVATVKLGITAMGTVLTDGQGHTLYYLSTEANGQDACTPEPGCDLMWPAVVPPSGGTPEPGLGVNGTLGVITAADGSGEVTYNGWPLHTFSGEDAGQVDGEDMTSFGGTWSVATPDMATTSNTGTSEPAPGLGTPPPSTPPGALPTNPFAPTTPPGIPTQPPLPTIPSALPTDPI